MKDRKKIRDTAYSRVDERKFPKKTPHYKEIHNDRGKQEDDGKGGGVVECRRYEDGDGGREEHAGTRGAAANAAQRGAARGERSRMQR